jgi:hypothetical protein
MDLLRIVIAILLPPLGVFLQVGVGKHFWINVPADDPRLHTGDHPRHLGDQQILIGVANEVRT